MKILKDLHTGRKKFSRVERCRFVRGKSHGDEASRRLSGVVSGARLGGEAQGAGEAAVFGAREGVVF